MRTLKLLSRLLENSGSTSPAAQEVYLIEAYSDEIDRRFHGKRTFFRPLVDERQDQDYDQEER